MIWIKSIGLKVWAYVVGGALGLLFLYRIYKAGEEGARVESLERTLEAVKRRNEIEDDNSELTDDERIDRLRRSGWLRD